MQSSPHPPTVDATGRDVPMPAAPRGRPCGLLGLTIGVVLIVVGAMILCMVAGVLAGGAAVLAMGVRRASELASGWREAVRDPQVVEAAGIVVAMLFYAMLSACVLLAARVRGRSHWRDIIGWASWNPLRRRPWFFWTIAAGAVVYGFAADALVERLYPPAKTWVSLPERLPWAIAFVVLAVVFAPITEELLFRGWIYTGFRRRIGIWEGINVSAALFALAHWERSQIYALVVFPLGLALGYLRERTGSLAAPMLCHAIYNGAASALLMYDRVGSR